MAFGDMGDLQKHLIIYHIIIKLEFIVEFIL